MKISRVLHAGYIFEDTDTRIIFDPIFENPFSGNCFAFPSVRFDVDAIRTAKFDAIFISHFHDDHCSLESLNLLDRNTPIFFFCAHKILFDLIQKLGFKNVHSIKLDCSIEIGKFKVTARKSFDADVDSILQIQYENLKLLNVVDAMIDPATLDCLKAEGPWDIVFWPFQTLREIAVLSPSRFASEELSVPEEWITELRALNPKFVVPSSCQFIHESWSWYNRALFPISYKRFETEIASALPEVKVIRINPSESFVLNSQGLSSCDSIPWITPVGEQNLDYICEPQLPAPSTAEIATHFELTDEQTKRVIEYFNSEILTRYRTLETTPYFEKKRLWKVSLYDKRGYETNFFYTIENENIYLASNSDLESLSPSWLTEAAIAKVYSALEHGEALTSMYMRINDLKFSDEIEKDLAEADLLEDPLVRTLFSEQVGAYQLHQLKVLKPLITELVI